MLKSQGLWSKVSGTEVKPGKEMKENTQEYEKKHSKALYTICSVLVTKYISAFRRYKNEKDTWDKFCKVHEHKNLKRRMLSLRSFYTTSKSDNSSMMEYILHVEALADEVKERLATVAAAA